jgi:hypothetical protein
MEPATAVDADVSMPASVVDLAQRREHTRALLPVHSEDGSEVLSTMMPLEPISRRSPPVAPAAVSFRGVPLRSDASVSVLAR